MLKIVLFQTHWFIGITFGTILAIGGLTGGLLSFEDDILEAINPGILSVVPRDTAPLTPQQLADAVRGRDGSAAVASVTVASASDASATVGLVPTGQGRGRQVYLDPYTGEALGEPSGRPFFQTMEQIHRWLVMPGTAQGIGKLIVGISTLLLVFLALSGLYLRWPARVTNWRAWFKLKLRYRGRALFWNLHAVIGTYVLLAYLVMALTGLWWSFDWYRNGASLLLTGKPAQTQQRGPGGGPPGQGGGSPQPVPVTDLAPAWQGFLGATGGHYETATFTLPRKAGDPVQVRFLAEGAAHDRAADQMKLDAATGAVRSHEKFAEKSWGERLYGSVFALHSGSYFGVTGVVLWMIASLAMPVFYVTGWLLYLDRRRHKRRDRERAAARKAAAAA
ncbi:MAG: PepSY domain-containing protein [Alphaproteobacteria bacterium]|nr:PepSY domain-containing protein [Alphaproteobacteria bacterium]